MISFFLFRSHRATTAVYQVTRPGHEHCDATEGILLDITPLVVDGKKLVTLYDKDLTEGVNLLIGMYCWQKKKEKKKRHFSQRDSISSIITL